MKSSGAAIAPPAKTTASELSLEQQIEHINQVLPQTQCQLCDYPGCRPYAEAIVSKNERIDRCPPGGLTGLEKLAQLTGQDASPYLATMKQKPMMLARIDESICIGCAKCIAVCPTDAILGAAKQMHTVIASECTGCELCLSPCPVDCIEMIELGDRQQISQAEAEKKAKHYRWRHERRQQRLTKEKAGRRRKHQQAKRAYQTISSQKINSKDNSIDARRQAVAAAIKRHRLKKAQQHKQDNSHHHDK